MHESPRDLHETPSPVHALTTTGTWEAPKGRDFPLHRHSTWELVYYRSGHVACPVGDQMYESQPGMFLLTPPFTFHAEYARTAYSNYFISIDAPVDTPWPRVCFDDANRTFGSLCALIVREFSAHASDRNELLNLLLRELDLLLRREHEREFLPDAEILVRQAERIIEEHWAEPLTIADVAAEVGTSPSSLRAHFAQRRHRAPKAYLQSLRVQRALSLIRTSSLSLEEIATVCGYDSSSHLSRFVKRATGHSPGSFRRH